MRDPASINIHELIDIGYHERASDVFVKGGSPPMMRLHAKVQPFPANGPSSTPTTRSG